MIPLNYHHLYYFYVIAKEASIARACEKLYLAQPTLSTQLKQFEKSVGHALFTREKQRLTLTERGRLVLDYAESIFELGSELKDALRDRPTTGQIAIQIGALIGTARSYCHALLESLLNHAPQAHVTLKEGSLAALTRDLIEHRLDVALSDVNIRGGHHDELANLLIGQVPIVFAASPALAKRHPRLPRDLDGAPFILPSSPSQVSLQVMDALAAWNVKPRIIAEVQDLEIARRLAIAGRGIAPLNAYTVSVSLPAKGLVILKRPTEPRIMESIYLITRKRKHTNPLTDYLLKNFRLPPK